MTEMYNGMRQGQRQDAGAISTATSPNVDKNVGNVPTPFGAVAKDQDLASGQTTNTFIQNKPVIVDGTKMDSSAHADEAGVNKGVASGTQLDWHQATSFSNDLFMEGKALVRTLDTNIANAANTAGIFLGKMMKQMAENMEKARQYKCSIEKVKGVEVGEEARLLGYADAKRWVNGGNMQGDPVYIETLTDQQIVLTSERYDVTGKTKVKNPPCMSDKPHTYWTVTYTTFPLGTKTVETFPGTETITVEAIKAINEKMRLVQAVKKQLADRGFTLEEDGIKDWARAFGWPESTNSWAKMLGETDPVTVQQSAKVWHKRWGKVDEDAKIPKKNFHTPYKETDQKRNVKLNIQSNLTNLLKLLFWAYSAPSIEATATGCADPKTVNIKVYPHGENEFKFSIGSENIKTARIRDRGRGVGQTFQRQNAGGGRTTSKKGMSAQAVRDAQLEMMLRVLEKGKTFAWICEKFFKLGGSELKIQVAKEVEFSMRIEFKKNHYLLESLWKYSTPATVGADWDVKITATLLKFGSSIAFSLWKFIPFVGPAAEKLLNYLGVRAELYFEASADLQVSGGIGVNEYRQIDEGTQVSLTGNIDPYAGVRVGFFPARSRAFRSLSRYARRKMKEDAEAAGLIANFHFPISVGGKIMFTTQKGKLIVFRPDFTMKVGFEMEVKAWRWFRWKAVKRTYPRAWQINWPPYRDKYDSRGRPIAAGKGRYDYVMIAGGG